MKKIWEILIQTVAKVTNQSLDQRKIDKLIKIMQNKDVLNDVEKWFKIVLI